MQIRDVIQSDSLDLFSWRNDKLSREMFRNSSLITMEEHSNWFEEVKKNEQKQIFIGLDDKNNKIGVCRFDIDDNMRTAEVSLNLNPFFRGKGLSRELLEISLFKFRSSFNKEIIANVKPSNIASLKVFENCNFYFKKKNKDTLLYTNKVPILTDHVSGINLEKVVGSSRQTKSLFEVLKNRTHSISHHKMPSFQEHHAFVTAHPYRVWYMISLKSKCVGSFYIQNDNSIGINLENSDKHKINFCLNFIKSNFFPYPEKKSIVPPYFYFNIPFSDTAMFEELNLIPIQTSFKL